MTNNLKKLLQAPSILTNILEILRDCLDHLTTVVSDIENHDKITKIQELGGMAHDTKTFSPEYIVKKYWPDRLRIVRTGNSLFRRRANN
jgi:hypothetical protein